MKTHVFAVITLLSAILVAGCSSIDDLDIIGDGTASTVFSDVPIPSGFALNESESHYQITTDSRSGHLLYSGWETTSQLVIFYQENLLENNWTMVSINITGQAGNMVYSKPLESLSILITSDSEKNASLTIDVTTN